MPLHFSRNVTRAAAATGTLIVITIVAAGFSDRLPGSLERLPGSLQRLSGSLVTPARVRAESGSAESGNAEPGSEDNRLRELAEKPPGERLKATIELWYEGNPDTALAGFEDLADDFDSGALDLSEHPEVAEETFEALIVLYRESGEYTRARNALERQTALEGNDEASGSETGELSQLMELYYLEGRPEDALSQFEKLAERQLLSELQAREHIIAARAYAATGRNDEAHNQIDQSLNADSNLATAYELRGRLHLEAESYDKAIDAFENARRREPNLSATLVDQARAHMALEEYRQARSLLTRATGARPHDEKASRLLTEVEEKRPELVEAEEEELARTREVTTPPSVAYMPDNAEEIPYIRVGLANSLGDLWLKSSSDWEIHLLESADRDAAPADTSALLEGERDELLNINLQNNVIEFRRSSADDDGNSESANGNGDNEPMLRHDLSDGWLELVPADEEATTILFDLEHSRGQFSAGSEDRSYRGALRFGPSRDSGFSVVNVLDKESYLYSVVPSEMPASWPEEALRAQAIAARSYTIANIGAFDDAGYDVSGSVRSAFYRGYSGEAEATTRAVDDTRGTVLTHEDRVLAAYYSANNAGHSDSPEDVWGGGPPGIVGVADPQLEWDGSPRPPGSLRSWLFDFPETYSSTQPFTHPPAYRWELWVDAEEVRERLQSDVGRIRSIRSEGRTPAGRLTAVRVTGEEGETLVSRDSIRRQLGSLRSNLFVMEPVYDPGEADYPGAFVFRGAGWGHGVGLDQTGAAGYASRGATADDILDHYFPEASRSEEY